MKNQIFSPAHKNKTDFTGQPAFTVKIKTLIVQLGMKRMKP